MLSIETPDWSEDNVIKLVELCQDNQLLWNPNHECYKYRYKRVDTFFLNRAENKTTSD
jgi:hypothetical protein